MPRSTFMLSPARRVRAAVTATLCIAALSVPLASHGAVAATPALPVSDPFRPSADIGFHDHTRDGSVREIRNDLTGDLGAMVEFAQETTVNPTGNKAENRPDVVADRVALLMVTPTSEVSSLRVEVSAKGAALGSLELAHPNLLPASDQTYDARGTVAYSLRAWSAQIPAEWMKPGLTLEIVDDKGRTGSLAKVEMAAPKEMVINNIRLGMITNAPVSKNHRFITDAAGGATDYFQTLPISKLTMAKYETVELDKVIVASGSIYTADNVDPSTGSVYAGTMRENVGKAQVSTGINLATWGITSSPMTQRQPQSTNQRVIHHSAGMYANGRHDHGLSGGNGMATLYGSVGNELSHELGHSFGIGHYPGVDNSKTGDDRVRNASHHMDSGWGYIAHRDLMRSNLATGAFQTKPSINGMPFSENLAGRYNFNTDAMAGGWDASPISDYTHHTAYTLTRIQDSLRTLVADTDYPSGYRDWDAANGVWVDAKQLNPKFALPAPTAVGVPVFTLLGGYNPAKAEQSLLYPAFRSNYGVTFDLPQADPKAVSDTRACWVAVDFDGKPSQNIALDASDGVKQLNVNIAEADRPTGAQVFCRTSGETTKLGGPITIATDLDPMPAAVVVGGDAGFDALRAQELKALEPKLEALSDADAPVLSAADTVILKGWADDITGLSSEAEEVATRILELMSDADDVEAYLAEHGRSGKTAADLPVLNAFLADRGYVGADDAVVPASTPVTVDNGRCLYRGSESLLVDGDARNCAETRSETWFADAAGRLHSGENPELCIVAGTPAKLQPCSLRAANQRWVMEDDGHVVRDDNRRSALDYHRFQGYPGMYNRSGGTNQVWKGFATDANPMLAYLSSTGLAGYFGNVTAVDEPQAPADGELPGGPVDGELPEAPGDGELPGAPVDGELPEAPGDGELPGGPVDDELPSAPADGELPQAPVEGELPGGPVEAPGTGLAPGEDASDLPAVGVPGVNPDDPAAAPESAGGLAITGGAAAWGAVGAAAVLLLAGVSLLLFRRARAA